MPKDRKLISEHNLDTDLGCDDGEDAISYKHELIVFHRKCFDL